MVIIHLFKGFPKQFRSADPLAAREMRDPIRNGSATNVFIILYGIALKAIFYKCKATQLKSDVRVRSTYRAQKAIKSLKSRQSVECFHFMLFYV